MEKDRNREQGQTEEKEEIIIINISGLTLIGVHDGIEWSSDKKIIEVNLKDALQFDCRVDPKIGISIAMFPYLGPTNDMKIRIVQSPPNYLIMFPTEDIIRKYKESLENIMAMQSGIIMPRNSIITPTDMKRKM